MTKNQTLLMICVLLFSVPSFAQFTLNGEIRPMTEYRDGFMQLSTASQTPAIVVSQRTHLEANFKKNNLETQVTLQDARIWGGNNGLSLYETWAKYHFTNHAAVKFGRQELDYDEGRLISIRNRRQEGYNYDAMVFKFAKDSLYADLGFVLNNSQANITGNAYSFASTKVKNLNYLYLKKYFDNGFNASLTAIHSGFQKPTTDTLFYKQTVGTKLDYEKAKFSTSVEAYYQTGKHKDGRAVQAYLVTAYLGYKIAPKAKLMIGTEIFSGHDATNTNTDYQSTLHVFDILEGARFRYSGNANYFRDYETHTAGGGLTDYYATLDFHPTQKWQTSITYHNFHLTKAIFDTNSNELSKGLGSETDVTVGYKVQKGTSLVLGYSLVIPTTTMEFVQHIASHTAQDGHYVWVMCITKFNMI